MPLSALHIMFFALLLFAICTNVHAILTAEEVAKQENAKPLSIIDNPLRKYNMVTKCEKDRIICQNSRLIYCDEEGKTINVTCSDGGGYGSGKYFCNCEGNGCDMNPPTNCPSTTRKCYQPGAKLPVPINCKAYSYCDETLTETIWECPANYIYNATLKKCQPGKDCNALWPDWWSPEPYFTPFPDYPEYYVFSYRAGRYDPYSYARYRVDKCSLKNYAVEERIGCTFRCTEEGLFTDPDPKNCTLGIYYSCSRNNGYFVKTLNKCPDGRIWDEFLQICSKIAKCQKADVDPYYEEAND